MTLVYFDSSALVKLVVDEQGSDVAATLWDACDAAVSSRLAYPEVRAALAAAARDHRIDARSFRTAREDWETFWSATQPVELTASVERAKPVSWQTRTRSAVPMPSIWLAPSPSDYPISSWPYGIEASEKA